MKGWLLDSLALFWAFPYWNLRKTWFRLRKTRGRCPCQNPGDSGEAHRTGCEAILHWVKPERFRQVCPLLERRSDGTWCCSVNARDVRPFWGLALRALFVFSGSTLLVVSLGVWTALRMIGYDVSYRQVLWPPAWHELNTVRSEFFLTKARADYSAGHLQEALPALMMAYQIDPNNYPAGVMLAYFRQGGSTQTSELIYRQLRQSHPEHRANTTQLWLRHLLAHGAFVSIVRLAREELGDFPDEAAWIHALLFACRELSDPKPLEEGGPESFSPQWRKLVAIEIDTLRGSLTGQALQARLQALAAETKSEYALFYALDRQIQGGWPQTALTGIQAARERLPGRTVLSLGLAAYAAAGQETKRGQEIEALLNRRRQITPTEIEVLCAHLIRYPHPTALQSLVRAWQAAPPSSTDTIPLYFSLFCAASIAQDDATKVQAEVWIKSASHELPRALTLLDQTLHTANPAQRFGRLLPALPSMPLEVTYQLFSRY